MKYGRIMPVSKTFDIIESDDFQEAKRMCGLDPAQVDHGTLWAEPTGGGVAIVVYEFGMFEPERTDYFALGGKLYVGSALLYGFDGGGDTVDFSYPPAGLSVSWFNSVVEVEQAIWLGLVERPVIKMNNVVVWQWPNPREAAK
jgi:hypothetical protein